jgi:hypothetical protein
VVGTPLDPTQAAFETPAQSRTELFVLNDTSRGRTVDARREVGDATASADLTVPATAPSTAGEIELPAEAATVSITLSVGDRTIRNQYDR